ncbi:MAG: TonB-dependent receptor [Verrucomicrobiales bacterium]|nr:TonB-dependent receptor [Verrucomicrobiales bacterium]
MPTTQIRPHLFLANSFNALRDPRQVNLRYETPWLSEYLVANLLAPVGAGQLSQTVSQNEYGKLFERDRFGFANETTWTSNGDWLQQSAQFGQFGNTAYALDAYYRSEVGQRPNADLEQIAVSATFKQQLTFSDSVFVQATWYNAESGDVAQRYDWSAGQLGFRAKERHEPLAAVAWHHEWRPGSHTLLLVSPWHSTLKVQAPEATARYFSRDEAGQIDTFDPAALAPGTDYQSRFNAVSTELQHIVQAGAHSVIAGSRYQIGEFDVKAAVDVSNLLGAEAGSGIIRGSASEPALERLSLYAYDQWQIAKPLLLTFGLSYDYLRQPVNFRSAPLSDGERTDDLISPKIGLTINPWRGATLRGAYARSLTGASFDQSFRLEPAQVAGFNQAYRGLIPEALTAAICGQELETSGVGFEQRLATGTYFTIQAELLRSEASRDDAAFEWMFQDGGAGELAAGGLRQDLDFTERSLSASIGQLVGRDLALSARYRLAKAELNTAYPEVSAAFPAQAGGQSSVLHQLELAARYHHPSGFFGHWESVWTCQSNHGDFAFLSGDNFWQHNFWLGWRFHQRDAELSVGLLNVTGQEYQLHPLNY